MTIKGTRFGEIEYREEDVISFDEGLIGFPTHHDYLLVPHKPQSLFHWLQSLDEPSLAFLVTEPTKYVPEYNFAVTRTFEDQVVLATVVIPVGKPQEMTLNLAGPIMIDASSKKARQVVLDDGSYTVKHRVFETSNSVGDKAAA
jgi:flagellar assembly factor FliW